MLIKRLLFGIVMATALALVVGTQIFDKISA